MTEITLSSTMNLLVDSKRFVDTQKSGGVWHLLWAGNAYNLIDFTVNTKAISVSAVAGPFQLSLCRHLGTFQVNNFGFVVVSMRQQQSGTYTCGLFKWSDVRLNFSWAEQRVGGRCGGPGRRRRPISGRQGLDVLERPKCVAETRR